LAGGVEGWQDVRGMYVLPGIEDGPPTVYWMSATSFHQALLESVVAEPDASASPAPGSSSSEAPSTDPAATP
jgi:hypothetical protein